MDGAIDCVSRQGVGTTFTVTVPLPAGVPAEDAQLPFFSTEEQYVRALSGKRMLVCEDNAINTLIVQRLLAKRGIHVVVAEDGQAGVETFAASDVNAFDAILMDVRMPVMDGLAATRAIRALPRADSATVPIIAMTANAFEEDEQASRAAGMNAHLAKPVDPSMLFATLMRFLA